MEGQRALYLIITLYAVSCGATSPSTKEGRTGALLLPEKIIGGVIDIVHSHKYKPTTPAPHQQGIPQPYQQYPQYQQWNGQSNYQNPGFNPQFQAQFHSQTPYNYPPQNNYQVPNYPQNGGSYSGNSGVYPTNQGFSTVLSQNQGPYQGGFQQQTGQYPVQPTGQYQQFQSPNNQYQQTSGQYGQGISGISSQASQVSGSGLANGSQGFQVAGGNQMGGNGHGPTCVCQTWTKPNSGLLKDSTISEKIEKVDVPTELSM